MVMYERPCGAAAREDVPTPCLAVAPGNPGGSKRRSGGRETTIRHRRHVLVIPPSHGEVTVTARAIRQGILATENLQRCVWGPSTKLLHSFNIVAYTPKVI